MQTAILKLGNENSIQFALESFTLIPFSLLKSIAWKLFLGPLNKHVPNAFQSMLHVASKNIKQLRVLHKLGIVLGIAKWMEDYQLNTEPDSTTLGDINLCSYIFFILIFDLNYPARRPRRLLNLLHQNLPLCHHLLSN